MTSKVGFIGTRAPATGCEQSTQPVKKTANPETEHTLVIPYKGLAEDGITLTDEKLTSSGKGYAVVGYETVEIARKNEAATNIIRHHYDKPYVVKWGGRDLSNFFLWGATLGFMAGTIVGFIVHTALLAQ